MPSALASSPAPVDGRVVLLRSMQGLGWAVTLFGALLGLLVVCFGVPAAPVVVLAAAVGGAMLERGARRRADALEERGVARPLSESDLARHRVRVHSNERGTHLRLERQDPSGRLETLKERVWPFGEEDEEEALELATSWRVEAEEAERVADEQRLDRERRERVASEFVDALCLVDGVSRAPAPARSLALPEDFSTIIDLHTGP